MKIIPSINEKTCLQLIGKNRRNRNYYHYSRFMDREYIFDLKVEIYLIYVVKYKFTWWSRASNDRVCEYKISVKYQTDPNTTILRFTINLPENGI